MLPIGRFLGRNPLTAIAAPLPFPEAEGVEILCELDANPKWYVNRYKSLKASGLVSKSVEASCRRP